MYTRYLPAETGTAVMSPNVMNRSYVRATLKLPSKLATGIEDSFTRPRYVITKNSNKIPRERALADSNAGQGSLSQ